MAQEYKPGEIVPQSGIYTITHKIAHAPKHVGEIGHLEKTHALAH